MLAITLAISIASFCTTLCKYSLNKITTIVLKHLWCSVYGKLYLLFVFIILITGFIVCLWKQWYCVLIIYNSLIMCINILTIVYIKLNFKNK